MSTKVIKTNRSVNRSNCQNCQCWLSELSAAVRGVAPPVIGAGRLSGTYFGRTAMLFQGGFRFGNFLMDVLTVFVFVVWLWLLITIVSDLFRRRDISGWGKALSG